jgi:methyl-accepting chemotaxis protein
MSIKGKLILGAICLAIIPIIAASAIIVWQVSSASRAALEDQAKAQLISIREMRAEEIIQYFETIRAQVTTFAHNEMVVAAMSDFANAYGTVVSETGSSPQAELASLGGYYGQDFAARYRDRNRSEPPQPNQLLGQLDAESIALQYRYISANPAPLGNKDELLSADDGSRYAAAHRRYHPQFREYLQKFGYYDIFLVDAKTSDIVYSVFKELDYTTSLTDGPYAASGIGEAFRAAMQTQDREFVYLTDFAPYLPSYNDPAAFIATPIFAGEQRIGVLIFQMPIDRINALLTSDGHWADVGLGESGETYIVGPDQLLRSQSRFLIEDQAGYLTALREAGVAAEAVERIESKGSSIGLQPVRTKGVEQALAGQSGFDIFPDYRNVPVLSAYRPLNVLGLNWALMSEIDAAEAFAPVRQLNRRSVFTAAVVALAVALLGTVVGLLFARALTRPIGRVVASLQDIASGDGDLTARLPVDRADELGQLATAFNTFVEKIHGVVREVGQSTDQLAAAAEEMARIADENRSRMDSQTGDTDQVATAMNQMAASVQEVAKHTAEVAQSMLSANEDIAQASQTASQARSGMQQLVNQVSGATEQVQRFANTANEITVILDVIKEIAEQTNLLALNAAIEAARAGEAGRGFAVVADEVRTLAGRTQESTQQIERMIEDLQSGSRASASRMDDVNGQAQHSIGEVDASAQRLDHANTTVNSVVDMNTQVAAATEEQSVVADQVSHNVHSIAERTTAAALAMSQIAEASEELAHLSHRMQGLVGQFRI